MIQMISSHFNADPTYYSHRDESRLKLNNHILGAWVDDDDAEVVACIFRYEAKAKVKRKDAFYLKCDFLVAYTIPSGVELENAKAYCQRAGLFAAYPFFRAYFSHVNGLANLDLPVLPVLNTGPVRVAKEKTEKAAVKRIEEPAE
jgi:hypothetical protein